MKRPVHAVITGQCAGRHGYNTVGVCSQQRLQSGVVIQYGVQGLWNYGREGIVWSRPRDRIMATKHEFMAMKR